MSGKTSAELCTDRGLPSADLPALRSKLLARRSSAMLAAAAPFAARRAAAVTHAAHSKNPLLFPKARFRFGFRI